MALPLNDRQPAVRTPCAWTILRSARLLWMTASPGSDALPLRVAHVGGYASETADGVQKTILGLLGHLPQHGIEVELWSCSPQFGEPRLSRVDGLPLLELPSRSRPASLLAPLPKKTREAIRDRARRVHLVHFHSVFQPENVWIARLLDAPYFITPHGGYGPKVLREGTGWRRLRGSWPWRGRMYALRPPSTQ